MKKRKILTRPTAISTIQLDDIVYDTTPVKIERLHIKALRKMRQSFAKS
jgi:hypothetical protein